MDKPGARRILSRSRWCGRPSVYYRSYALPNGSRFLKTPFRRYPYKSSEPLRLSWRGFVGALDDQPFEMEFSGSRP